MNRLRLLAVVCVAATVGCSTPAYKRPEVDLPDGWQTSALTNTSLADQPWGELFDKPELKLLIESALSNNRELRIAAQRVDFARAKYGFERSSLFPALSAEAAYTSAQQPQVLSRQSENTDFEVYALGLQVPSWEIDLWGRLRSATEAMRRQLLASENTRRALFVSLIAQVSTNYLELLEFDAKLEIAEKAIALRGESLKLVRTRYTEGIAAAIDVRQAEALVASAEQTAAGLKVLRAQEENRLSLLLGRNPGPIIRSARLSDYYAEGPILPAGLPSQLLERRPDIVAAEQQLIAAGASLDAARKAFFPIISLTGFLGFASPEFDELFDGTRDAWSTTATISAPIFTAGRLRSNVEAAQAQQRIALEQYQATIQNAFREVDDALVSFRWLSEQRDALQRLVLANRERVKLADIRYQAAVSGYLEILNAQQDLFDAEILLTQITRSVYGAVVQLYAALGGGGGASHQITPTGTPSNSSVAVSDHRPLAVDTSIHPVVQESPRETPRPPQDRIDVRGEGAASVINVHRVTGTGGAAVSAPASGWPSAIYVRLHDFVELERFSATSADLKFECKLQPANDVSAEQPCMLNGSPTGGLRRISQGFEVSLPAIFSRRNSDSFEIRWFDKKR